MKIVAAVLLVFALGGSVATADPRPAPPGLPNVLCRKPTFPGRAKPTTAGSYSYKPGSCVLEIDEKSLPNGNSTHLLAIEWKRWNERSARGIGLIPITVESLESGERYAGREHVLITLGHPVTKCGRLVFTRAHVHWSGGDFEFPYRLHRVPIIGRGCP